MIQRSNIRAVAHILSVPRSYAERASRALPNHLFSITKINWECALTHGVNNHSWPRSPLGATCARTGGSEEDASVTQRSSIISPRAAAWDIASAAHGASSAMVHVLVSGRQDALAVRRL